MGTTDLDFVCIRDHHRREFASKLTIKAEATLGEATDAIVRGATLRKERSVGQLSVAALTKSKVGQPPIRGAATGIFLWPTRGLYDTIEGDEFKHNNFFS